MKITKSIELNPQSLKAIILAALKLPENTKVDFNVSLTGSQHDEYYAFKSATVTTEEEFKI